MKSIFEQAFANKDQMYKLLFNSKLKNIMHVENTFPWSFYFTVQMFLNPRSPAEGRDYVDS